MRLLDVKKFDECCFLSTRNAWPVSEKVCSINSLPSLYAQVVRNIRFARDSAGTQTGQTRIVSCDRLVSTTIYAIWGLPINELYASGPCRPLIRYPSEANLSVIFSVKS
jgi:hypothetical protein